MKPCTEIALFPHTCTRSGEHYDHEDDYGYQWRSFGFAEGFMPGDTEVGLLNDIVEELRHPGQWTEAHRLKLATWLQGLPTRATAQRA